ncbi:MAG TPA: GNAT family N-acetyltransferase [bacterium]|nr:GNAT family N-acetyltransferase [bacterium]HPN45603.1 GNAT family N-acetyltransferase [bacterium]
MKKIQVLSLSDKQEWRELVRRFPDCDIYFHPNYIETCTRIMPGTPFCFVYHQAADKVIIKPFFKRRINDEPEFSTLKEDYYDTISPYGYNGCLTNCQECDIQDFFTQYDKYCLDNNIISEFVRLHPLIRNDLYKGLEKSRQLVLWNETVHIKLDKSLEEIRGCFGDTNTRNIKKAVKNGLKVVELPYNTENVSRFHKMYTSTMERLQTTAFYFFSLDYFDSLRELLGEYVKLFAVEYNQEYIALGLFFTFGQYCHYHLGASQLETLHLRPNNILFSHIIEWAKNAGYKLLHLGGGRHRDDDLFRFKKSFSDTTAPFYIIKKIHHNDVYKQLTEFKINYKIKNNLPEVDNNYFPAYRG